MKAFGFSIVALCLAGCASDVSQEEIARAEHQPYDDVAVTEQALGAVETITRVCDEGCWNPIAMWSEPDAAIKTGADTILRVVVGTGVTSTHDVHRIIVELVAASDQTLYFSFKDKATGSNQRVARLTADGVQTWMFDGVGAIRNLTVDATSLYFVDDRGLMKQPRAGGAGLTIVPAANVNKLLGVDSTRLYFTNGANNQIRQIKLDGTDDILMKNVADSSLAMFTQDSSYLYYSIGNDVVRVQKTAPFQAVEMGTFANQVLGIAAKNGALYFIDWATPGGPNMVLKRTTGGLATTIRTAPALQSPRIVGNYLYWLENAKVNDGIKMKRALL